VTVCSGPAMDGKLFIKSALQAACTATAPVRPLPDFLIIGGQRCGTTALHDHLARHPSVGAAHVKEVHYFDLNYDRGERWYRGHFPNDARRAVARRRTGVDVVCGEASPYYLYHPLVPERARALVPDARLIVLLRDPVARALSHYHHEVALGMEPLSFEDALDAESERLDGEERRIVQFPGYISVAHQHHSYVARGHYADQLERWFGSFPRDRMLMLVSEDFFADPAGVVGEILEFLALPPMPQAAPFRVPNARSYEGMEPATRRLLIERFRESNARLTELLGRDPGWPS